jgi:hypothetical protein
MFANCQLAGLDLGFPDVCLTPPLSIPIPYVNISLGCMAIPETPNVLIGGLPAHNVATPTPCSFGDEPGCLGGIISGTIMCLSLNITGAITVLIGCFPATRMTSLTVQNLCNVIGIRILPSQLTVIILAP